MINTKTPFGKVISSHFNYFEWSKWPKWLILKMVNSAVHFHSKWFETVQFISILSISIPNGLKQCSLFPFYLFSFQIYCKQILILSISSIWNDQNNFKQCSFYLFLLFGIVKTILTIPNGNDQNNKKWLFQTGPNFLQQL